MRIKLYLIGILCLLIFKPLFSQSSGDYRTAGTGNWNVAATWQTYNGASWVAAGSSPTSANGVITIQSGHTVTVTANVTVDQVVVTSGGQITIQSGRTVTLADGAGTDLSVTGTIDNQGTITLSGSAAIAYNSGGLYNHNQNGGTIPVATWNNGSTCQVTGMTNTAPGGMSQAFYNFTWNCPGETGNVVGNGILTTINGTMTMVNTGTANFIMNTNFFTVYTVGVDYIQTGGYFTLTDANTIALMSIAGNFSLSGGTFEVTRGFSGTLLNVAGNFTYSGGSLVENNTTGAAFISFNGTSVQNFTSTSSIASTEIINFTINSGAIVYAGTSAFTGGGNFTLSNGGTLGIGSPNGITSSGALGNVQVLGTRTYGTSANYIYNGTAAQNTGNGLPATVNNLTDNNTSGVVNLGSNVAVNGTLTVIANAILRPAAANIISGTGTLTGNGTVQVTRTAATPDFNSQFTITNKTLTNLTVDYNAANQVLSNITYGYLKISGSILPGISNAAVGAGLTVTGTFTPTGGTITFNNGSTITNSGTLTFKNVTLLNSATVTTASSFNIDGTLNVGTSALFNATNLAITLKDNAGVTSSGAVNFSSLNIDRPVSGNIILNGSMTVNGVLDLINGSITLGNYNLTMSSGASFNNVSSAKYIVTNGTGMLTRNNVGSSSVLFPVGTTTSYNPVSVVNNGTVDNFSVRVQPTFDNSPVDPTKVVNRQWTVNEAVPGGSIGYLSFQFNSGEWAGSFNLASPMSVGRWNGSAWVGYVADISGSGPYTVTNRNGDPITSFSPFGVGNEGSLPVLLSYFNSAVYAVRDVKLNWGTTLEINNRGFDVERNDISKPNSWVKIGFVQGFGNSNESHDYSFTDQKLSTGTYKYRLKQMDYNGNFEYFYLSNEVIIGKPADYSVSQNYPNPSNPNSKIDYQLPFNAKVTVKLYDMLGRQVATVIDKNQEAGYYTEIIDGTNLSSGIYIYRFTATGEDQAFTKTMKMVLVK